MNEIPQNTLFLCIFALNLFLLFTDMFSALKRLTSKTENGSIPGTSPGHHTMSQNLQRKFAKGVQYNSECDVLTFIF